MITDLQFWACVGVSSRYLHDKRRPGAQVRRRVNAAEHPAGGRATAGNGPSVVPGRSHRPELGRRRDGDGGQRVDVRGRVRHQRRADGPAEPHRVPAGAVRPQAAADPVDADGQLYQDDDVLRQSLLETSGHVWPIGDR